MENPGESLRIIRNLWSGTKNPEESLRIFDQKSFRFFNNFIFWIDLPGDLHRLRVPVSRVIDSTWWRHVTAYGDRLVRFKNFILKKIKKMSNRPARSRWQWGAHLPRRSPQKVHLLCVCACVSGCSCILSKKCAAKETFFFSASSVRWSRLWIFPCVHWPWWWMSWSCKGNAGREKPSPSFLWPTVLALSHITWPAAQIMGQLKHFFFQNF